MSDSEVPNSKATPGWKDYKFPRTCLIDAIQTKVVDGNDHQYTGNVPVDWCAGIGSRGSLPAHGGFLCAAIVNSACQFGRAHFKNMEIHEPRSLNVEFLLPVPQGPFCVTLAVLHSSNSTATIQANLAPANADKNTSHCHAIVRIGRLTQGGALGEGSNIPKHGDIPDRLDCDRWVDASVFYANPYLSTARLYTPRGGPNRLWSPRFGGRKMRYTWYKLDNERLFQLEYLILLADMIPPMPLNYREDGLRALTKYQMPTISLQINFREDIRGEEWLLTKTEMRWHSDGRFDLVIDIINDRGQVVATSNQLVAMVPSQRSPTVANARGRL